MEVRVGTTRVLADMMERRKLYLLCMQETRWKGSKTDSNCSTMMWMEGEMG